MSRDFDKAQEMVLASMEYVKILGCRIRRTEVQRDDWKLVAQSHADELIKLRQHVDALKAERDAAKQEAASARQDAVTRAEADRKRIDGLMIQVQDMRAEIERLKKPARNHPVAVGEWVRRTDAECDEIYFGRGVIAQVIDIHDAPEKQYTVSRPEWNGYCVPWAMQYCEPCDPPEATHDTPEGKQAAESVIRNDRKTEPDEIKVGDVAKVRSASGNLTAKCDVGQIGEVLKIDSRDGTVLLSGEAGWVDIQDVRKVTT